MTLKTTKAIFTTANILIILGIANLMFLSGMFGYVQFSTQYKQQVDQQTNQTAIEIKNLIKAINRSDEIDDNRTKDLLEATVQGQMQNYHEIVNGTNQTNTLVSFLSDNFGSGSGYLEKENFQYLQANKTFDYLVKSLINQKDIIINQCLRFQQLGLTCANHLNETTVN